MTWTLLALARNPEIQSKLRAELATVSPESLTIDELVALPYLDSVVREALRVCAVVNGIVREATKDAVVPLSKPFLDTKGVLRNEIQCVLKTKTLYANTYA